MDWKYLATFLLASNISAFAAYMFMKRLEKKEYYTFGMWITIFIVGVAKFVQYVLSR